MSLLLPKGVSSYRDRHGKERFRYRRSGRTVALRGRPGETQFDADLNDAPDKTSGHRTVDRRVTIVREHMVDHYARSALPRAKHRSLQKKVPFDLTATDFKRMMVDQQFRCAVSGIEFPTHRVDHPETKAFRPSIDRIKPRLGYVVGNVRIVCEIANVAMNQWGSSALEKLVSEMANHLANRMANRPNT